MVCMYDAYNNIRKEYSGVAFVSLVIKVGVFMLISVDNEIAT